MRIPLPERFLQRPPTAQDHFLADLKIILLFVPMALPVIAVVIVMACKLIGAYATHVRAEENSVEWHVRQQQLLVRIEEVVRSSPTRCSDTKNTLELVHRHEFERRRFVAAVFRSAGGYQYKGVEQTLPQPITMIDCGVWKLT